jgi:hypothetical protein
MTTEPYSLHRSANAYEIREAGRGMVDCEHPISATAMRDAEWKVHLLNAAYAAGRASRDEEVEWLREACREAHHALTLVDGCIVTDLAGKPPTPGTTWEIDNSKELRLLSAALSE